MSPFWKKTLSFAKLLCPTFISDIKWKTRFQSVAKLAGKNCCAILPPQKWPDFYLNKSKMSKDKSHLLRLEHPFLYWQSIKSTLKSSRGVIFFLPFNSYIRHIARLSLLYCYYLGRCSTKLLARNSQNSFFTTSKRVFFLYSCTQRQAELA